MHRDDMQSLKETGQKGDFLLPFVVVNTIMPDFYTTYPMHWHDEMEIVYVENGEYEEYIDLEKYHVKQAVKLGDYNVGRNGNMLILPLYMGFLLDEY